MIPRFPNWYYFLFFSVSSAIEGGNVGDHLDVTMERKAGSVASDFSAWAQKELLFVPRVASAEGEERADDPFKA